MQEEEEVKELEWVMEEISFLMQEEEEVKEPEWVMGEIYNKLNFFKYLKLSF
jgi:hypothetical protein